MSYEEYDDSAGSDDPAAIYAQLAGEDTGADAPAAPASRQAIHAVGSTPAALAAAATATHTVQPTGVAIKPLSIEMSDAVCAGVYVTGLTIGGLPILHGGSLPGDAFKSSATVKVRPILSITQNNTLKMDITSIATASITPVVGVKGYITKNRT